MLKRIIKVGSVFSLLAAFSVASWAEQTWTVNFKDSDIEEVIKFVADVTGKTTVIDQRVKGRVKVISSKPLNEAELLTLFRTVLEIHDFTLVEVDDVIRVVPLKDARSSPVPVTDAATDEQGFVTQVIQLQNIAAAKARKAQAVLERHPVVLEILQQLSIAKEEQGLSYADLTERTGIERSSLARLLNSGTNPKLLTLEALAKALGKNLKVTVTD